MANDFDIDARNKLGAGEWDDELDTFVRALNGDQSAIARLRASEGQVGDGGEIALDPVSVLELRSVMARYSR